MRRPPSWIQKVLRRFASEETLEEIEGDLLEFYSQWLTSMGPRRANGKYLITALTLLRPFRKKYKDLQQTTFSIMTRSYLITSWRSIVKNRVSSFINVSGLALGLTTSLLILLVVLQEFSYDRMHIKKDSIFMIMRHEKTNEGISTGRNTPGPMAEALRSDFPEVVRAARTARFFDRKLLIRDVKWDVSGGFIEPDIFRMMTYNPVHGDPVKALERNAMVLTESKAFEFFGEEDPIGQTVVFDGYHVLEVGAIIKDIPSTSTLKFEMAVPFKVMEKTSQWLNKWDDNRINTWVELAPNTDLVAFDNKMSLLVQQKTNEPFVTQFAYPLSDLHLYGSFSNGKVSGGNIEMVRIIIGFGVFMLLIACVNFMNIATAQSAFRSREIGVRKVMGASRWSIVFQFLNESLMITFIALGAAIVLTVLVIPSFNLLTHSSISFDLTSGAVWMLSIGITLTTALFAGGYPSLVISRFAPARVLKGIVDKPKGLHMRRILVTFQFIISISVLVGTIVLYAQFDHVRERPMGYDKENLVNIMLDSLASAKFEYVKDQVGQIPGVESITGMNGNILYSSGAISGMDWPGKKVGEELSIVVSVVSYDWSKTMGIEMISGRDFSPQFKSDEGSCLLNQAAIERMGLVNPIGSVVGGRTVIGVFRDYVYNNPSGTISPMTVWLSPSNVQRLYMRVDNNETWVATMKTVEKTLKEVSSEMEFAFRFTTEEFNSEIDQLADIGLLVGVFGGMTIFISCLGLFGLSGFVAERRSKEMSIRKVFGADSIRILVSLSGDVIKPVVAALLIVIPLSVWVSDLLLNGIVYHVSLTWWMFAKAAIVIVGVAFLVVLYHALRTAVESPARRLKSE